MNRNHRFATTMGAMAAYLCSTTAGANMPIAPIGAEPLNLLDRYPANTEGRDFVVGDLLGCRAIFDDMLTAIGFDKERDRMFCTGNLGNYGPDPLGCYQLLREPWFRAVAGSDEALILRAASKPGAFDWTRFIGQGGMWASRLTPDQLLDLAALITELPLAIIVGEGLQRFHVIHAEFHGPNEALEDALENITTAHPVPRELTWGQDLITGKRAADCHEGLSATFCGHTPVAQVGQIGSQIYLNTGVHLAERSGDHGSNGLTIIEPKTGAGWRSRSTAQ